MVGYKDRFGCRTAFLTERDHVHADRFAVWTEKVAHFATRLCAALCRVIAKIEMLFDQLIQCFLHRSVTSLKLR